MMRNKDKGYVLLLLLTTLIVYGQTLRFSYTWFDDDAILITNEDYISDFSNVLDAVTRDAEFRQNAIELYRPLQNVSFMVDAAVGGFHPGVFHFTNLLIHILTCAMFFLLLRQLGLSNPISLLGSALLALHPVFAMAVAWLPARGDLLLALWTVTSFFLFIRFTRQRSPYLLGLHLITFALALLAKESGVMIIGLCLLWYLFFNPLKKWEWWQLVLFSGYIVLIILYFMLRSRAIYGIREGAFGPGAFLINLQVIPEVLWKFFIPFPLVTLPFYQTGRTLAGAVVIIILAVLLFRIRDKRLLLLSMLWFLGFTAPSMFYRPEWSDYIYDYLLHRSYLPLMGVIMMVLLLLRNFETKLFKRPLVIAVAVCLVVFAVLGFRFTKVFSGPRLFWEHAVATNPSSAFAFNYLGNAQFVDQETDKAVDAYSRAIELKPDFREAILARGIANASRKRHKEAIHDFHRVLSLSPSDTVAMRFRAGSNMEIGMYDDAIGDLKQLVSNGDSSGKLLYQYALGSLLVHDFDNAKRHFDILLRGEPDNLSYLRLSALTDLLAGNPEPAIIKYLKVLSATPDDVQSLANLGYAYWEHNDFRKALQLFEKSNRGGEGSLSNHLGLAITYQSLGRREELRRTKDELLAMNPAFTDFAVALKALESQGYLFTERQKVALVRVFR